MDRKDAIKIILSDILILGAIAYIAYEWVQESKSTGSGTPPYECTEAAFREMGTRPCEAWLNQ